VHGRLLISLVLAFALLVEPAAAAKPQLTVMTRNVYLGGNIAGPIPAPNREEFERSASALWAAVRTTDFPARAKLLAREVKQRKPDVIGLQEVALWRRGPKDGDATQATTVVYDFLKSLKGRLGPGYKIASVQQEAELEAPIADGYDVRLTMRDVVIVRKRVKVRRKLGANYRATLEVPTAIGGGKSRVRPRRNTARSYCGALPITVAVMSSPPGMRTTIADALCTT